MRQKELQHLNVKQLIGLLKKDKQKTRTALDRFKNEILIAYKTNEFVFGSEMSVEVKQRAMQNLLINCVSCIEVFLKELIVEYKTKWSDAGIAELLTEKVSLGKAYELIHKARITKIDLIVHYSSFNSLESIGFIFSKLTGTDFLQTLQSEHDGMHKEFIVRMGKVFSIRNQIIHEGGVEVTHAEVGEYFLAAYMVGIISSTYFRYMLKKPKK